MSTTATHDLVIEEHTTAAGRQVYVATCRTCKTWGPTQEERVNAEADLEWLPMVACTAKAASSGS